MRTVGPLPPQLALRPFTTAQAEAFGVPRRRLEKMNTTSPHFGVHIPPALGDSRPARLWAALVLAGEGAAFAADTACEAAGMWHALSTDAIDFGEPYPQSPLSLPLDVTTVHLHVPRAAPCRSRPGIRFHRDANGTRPMSTGRLLVPLSDQAEARLLRDRTRLRVPDSATLVATKSCPGARARHELIVRVPIVHPFDAWISVCSRLDPDQCAVLGDRLLDRENPLATIEQLATWLAAANGRRGAARAKAALPRMRARTDSSGESWLRLRVVENGFPCPDVKPEIALAGRRRRVDLAYLPERVALEYDGRHRLADAGTGTGEADRERQRDLVSQGWIVLRATAATLTTRLVPFLYDLRQALAHRRAAFPLPDLPAAS